jgi:hypothetical protein
MPLDDPAQQSRRNHHRRRIRRGEDAFEVYLLISG